MTQDEIDFRMAYYQIALADGRITKCEFDGFIEALRSILKEEAGR